MNNVINYYEQQNEESRLTATKARRMEFNVTTSILNSYIDSNSKIIELGAGTGIYSIYFAEKGNDVVATDITPKHVEIIEQKLKERDDNINLCAKVQNATDLRDYESESFDVVLCLGPMYHLINEDDRDKCISEALRVLKKGGLLAIAYVNKNFILHHVMLRNKEFLTKSFIDKILNTGVIQEGDKECFWTDAFFTSPSEMELLLKNYNAKIIDHVATDGFSPLLRGFIDDLNEDEYSAWIYYNLNSCRDKSILGMSNHGLLLCRKN